MGDAGGVQKGSEEPGLLGVRLDQYAGVTAALAEGIPLRDVLAQERIDEAAWPPADRAWKETLVEAPDLHLRFTRLQRQAGDCLSRRIEPLDEDPAAWAGLLGALTLADDPDGVLRSLGLRMTDVGRLGRRWRGKAEKDPAVADRLTALAGAAKPPAQVRCGPTELRPFPWTPPARSSAGVAAVAPVLNAGSKQPEETDAALDGAKGEGAGRPDLVPSYLAAMRAGPVPPIGAAPRQGEPPFVEPPALRPPVPEATLDLPGGPGGGSSPLPEVTLDLPGGPGGGSAPLPFSGRPGQVAASSGGASPRVDTGTVDASDVSKRGDVGAGPVIAGLTLAQHASLSAELSVHPDQAAAILTKYRIDGDDGRRRATEAWNAVLLRDPALRARWMQLTAEFRAWLTQQKRAAGG